MAADFVETALDFELDVQDVSGFDRFAGGSSTAELVIEFDHDGNAGAVYFGLPDGRPRL